MNVHAWVASFQIVEEAELVSDLILTLFIFPKYSDLVTP